MDDGPHTLQSMIQFIELYSQTTTDDGVLIIEDIQYWDWIGILNNEVPEDLKIIIIMYALHILSGYVQAAHTNTAHTHTDVHATHMHTQTQEEFSERVKL